MIHSALYVEICDVLYVNFTTLMNVAAAEKAESWLKGIRARPRRHEDKATFSNLIAASQYADLAIALLASANRYCSSWRIPMAVATLGAGCRCARPKRDSSHGLNVPAPTNEGLTYLLRDTTLVCSKT